jgi:calcineurin-like phosphoesterase family protein
MKKIFVSADTHFGHYNILKLCNRNFNSILEHDEFILGRHNSVVSNNDDYYFLGDMAYRCEPSYVAKMLGRMNFQKCYFICGNHEKIFRQAYKMGLLAPLLKSGKLEIVGGAEVIYDSDIYINKTFNINGRRVFMGHCASRTWPHAFRDCIHLFGHSHGRLGNFYKSMDVGVDTNNYYPWAMDKIIEIMDAIKDPFTEDGNLKYKQSEDGKEEENENGKDVL